MMSSCTLAAASRKHQEGVASILTVIFFILIGSVITIGFMRLSLNESQQALGDSMSKSALAAAYSGVNDAKRALLYCLPHKNDPLYPWCDENNLTGINNPNCPGFFENEPLRTALQLDSSYDVRTGIRVGEDPTATVNERYTCVIVSSDTYDVSGPLRMDQPDRNTTLVPLKSESTFDTVRISWHRKTLSPDLTGLTYDGAAGSLINNYRDSDAYGTYFKWDTDWPALLKASLFAHPKTGITYNADGSTNIADKTTYLYPRNIIAPSLSVPIGTLIPRQLTNCNSTGYIASGEAYLCQISITGLAGDPAYNPSANTLYLQLSNLYLDTDFTVELFNGLTPVKFDDVSPEVDSTGAVGDTFRRVKVRLRYQGSTPIMSNALDVGSGVCKNFTVGLDATMFNEDCDY